MSETRQLTQAEAYAEGLRLLLRDCPETVVFGQGVDDPLAMFGTTRGLVEEFGPARVFDTPISENAMAGIACGAALAGLRPVYLHNRADFLLMAMDQIVNHIAKWRTMTGGRLGVPLIIWACIGRGWGAGAQHTQAIHALFAHIPGLRVALPATPADAKGMLLAAAAGDDPTLFFAHRWQLRARGPVPEGRYLTPLGRACRRREGADATVIALSYMVDEALAAADLLAAEGIRITVLDLRSLQPLDEAALVAAAAATGRVVIADTGWAQCGAAAEIAARLAERCPEVLRAPVRRVTPPPVPCPSASVLEAAYYPGSEAIAAAVRGLLAAGN